MTISRGAGVQRDELSTSAAPRAAASGRPPLPPTGRVSMHQPHRLMSPCSTTASSGVYMKVPAKQAWPYLVALGFSATSCRNRQCPQPPAGHPCRPRAASACLNRTTSRAHARLQPARGVTRCLSNTMTISRGAGVHQRDELYNIGSARSSGRPPLPPTGRVS